MLPLVVLALLLVIQVGLVVRAQVVLVDAAREGARAAAVEGTAAAAAAAARASPGLDPARMQVQARVGVPGSVARVEVRYRVRTDVPLVGTLVGDVALHAAVAMRVEDPAGEPAPAAGTS